MKGAKTLEPPLAQPQRIYTSSRIAELWPVRREGLEPTCSRHSIGVTSRKVVWLFLEQVWFEFVLVFHRLQGRLAAQG